MTSRPALLLALATTTLVHHALAAQTVITTALPSLNGLATRWSGSVIGTVESTPFGRDPITRTSFVMQCPFTDSALCSTFLPLVNGWTVTMGEETVEWDWMTTRRDNCVAQSLSFRATKTDDERFEMTVYGSESGIWTSTTLAIPAASPAITLVTAKLAGSAVQAKCTPNGTAALSSASMPTGSNTSAPRPATTPPPTGTQAPTRTGSVSTTSTTSGGAGGLACPHNWAGLVAAMGCVGLSFWV